MAPQRGHLPARGTDTAHAPASAPAHEADGQHTVGNAGLAERLGPGGPPPVDTPTLAAAAPPADPTLDPSFASRARASLGSAVDGVRLHGGDGAAESMGAAAYAHGKDIHLADATIGPDGRPDEQVLAHEFVHVAQQAGPKSDADFEGEAHARAADVLAGRPAEVAGTGGPAIQRLDWGTWWAGLFTDTGSVTDETKDETTKAPRTHVGTGTPVLDAEGAPVETPRSGTITHDKTTDTWKGRSTDTGTTTHDTNAAGETTATEDRKSSSWSWWDLLWSSSETTGSKTTKVDKDATTAAVKSALTDEAAGVEVRLGDVDGRLTETRTARTDAETRMTEILDEERARLTAEGRAADDDAVAEAASVREDFASVRDATVRLIEQEAALERERDALAARKDALTKAAAGVTDDNAAATAASMGVNVEGVTVDEGTTKTTNTTLDIDLLAGKGSRTTSTTTAETAEDFSHTTTSSTSRGVKIDKGLFGTHESSSSIETKVGDTTFKSSDKTSTHAGLVAAGDGEFGLGGGRSTEETRDGRSVSTSVGGSVTNKGVAVDGSVGAGHKGEHFSGGTKLSGTGSFRVDVKPVEGTAPPQYDLVLSLSAGGTLGGDVGAEGDTKLASTGDKASGSASLSGSVGGSAKITFTHRMDAEEAEQYLGDVERAEGGAAPESPPEFPLLARLEAMADQVGSGNVADVLGTVDPDAAASLGDGNSVELLLTGTASASGSASGSLGAFGVGANGGASTEVTRSVKVSSVKGADGSQDVKVTVAFGDKDSWNAGGSVTAEGVTASGKHTETGTTGYSATFVLDPDAGDYRTAYERVIGAVTESELRALADDPVVAAHATANTTSKGDSTADTLGLAGFGLGLSIDDEHRGSESITRDAAKGDSFEVVGGSKVGGTAKLADVTLAGSSTDSAATVKMDGGGTLDVHIETAERDTTMFGGDSATKGDTVDGIETVLSEGVAESLSRALTETFTRLRGFDLDESAFDTLAARASDEPNWRQCAEFFLDEYFGWVRLGGVLRNPSVAPEFEADPVRGRRLTQARAFAGFFEEFGDDARVIVRNALRSWGEGINDSTSAGGDVGFMFEWPDAIASNRDTWYSLRDRVAGLPAALDPLIASGDTASAGTLTSDLTEALQTLYDTIDGCNDFDEPRAKLEMLDALGRMQNEVYEQSLRVDNGEGLLPDEVNDALAAAEEVSRLERLLPTFKAEERRLFAQARSMSIEDAEGFFGTVGAMWNSLWGEDVNFLIGDVRDLHEFWINRIVALRAAYVAAEIDPAMWLVSAGPGDARQADTEPDADAWVHLWDQNEWDRFDIEGRIASEKARLTTY